MYDLSIIVTINKYEKNLKKLLNLINNQKSCSIELIFIHHALTIKDENRLKKLSSKYNNVKIINNPLTYFNLIKEISGKYFIFITSETYFKIDKLKSIYDSAESNNLDILLFKKENSEIPYEYGYFENELGEGKIFNKKSTVENLFKMPLDYLFKLFKKETIYFNTHTLNKDIHFQDPLFFYETYLNSQKVSFKNISFIDKTKTIKQNFNLVEYSNGLLDIFLKDDKFSIYENSVINESMNYLIRNFKKYPLKSKQKCYESIKNDFKGLHELKELFKKNLTDENLLIYNIFRENKYYLDFLANYKLITTDYVILKDNKQSQNNYKISVVIPTYNTGNILHRTLFSIENQTFGIENIEIILVDDSSNDNTANILNEYAELDNYKIITIKNRTGSPGTPRNIGLKEATSDYVMFLDHDDFFEIDALETLYDAIDNDECDLVYGTYVSVDLGLPTKITYPNEKQGFFPNIDENERSIAFPPPSIWTKLFNREFLINNNILFTEFLGEDAIFMSKVLSKANGINYLGDTIICYHDLSNNSTTKKITYDYLYEGLISEEYLYNLYMDMGKGDYYKIRGENILDFYLTQFYKAKLTEKEVLDILPEIYQFSNRFKKLGVEPNNSNNKILFEHILQKDLDSILIIKNIEVKKDNKLKIYLENITNKLKFK